jgi:hypothetical protein
MFRTLRSPEYNSRASELQGANVYGRDDEKLGTVEDAVLEEDGELKYLVVDASWLNDKKYLVPVERVYGRPEHADDFAVDLTRDEVEGFARYDEACLQSEPEFRSYEKRYLASWPDRKPNENFEESGRLQRFKQWLRGGEVAARKQVTSATTPSTVAEVAPRNVSTGSRAIGAYGVYQDRESVEKAVDQLRELGFQNSDISVLFPEKDKSKEFAVEKGTKAPEGALAGGGTGLVIGGALGWLAGIGAIAIPGIGPLIAAGPIVAAIAGAGVGSALGGIAGALVGLGVPEYEAKRYESDVKAGGILLSVHCDDLRFSESARKVLESTGAKNVFTSGLKAA